jgi:hypothetical protein
MRLTEDDEVSSAGELRPRALAEPYVSVSTHTAPAIHRHGIAPNGFVSAMNSFRRCG